MRVRRIFAGVIGVAMGLRPEVAWASVIGFGSVGVGRPAWFVAAEEPGRGRPVVHVDGARTVELIEVVEPRGASLRDPIRLRTVCTGACDRVVDGRAGSAFFFELEGRRSREFRLESRAGHVFVTIRPARPGLRIGGVIVAAIGAALVAGGAYVGARASDAASGAQARAGGGAIVGVGATIVGGGLAMFILGRMRARVHDVADVQSR